MAIILPTISKKNRSHIYILAIILCLLSIATPAWLANKCTLTNVYPTSSKPRLPDRVFGIVWTVLFTFMAISLYLLLTSSLRDYYHPWNKVIIVLTMIGYVLNYAYIYAAGCKRDKTIARYALIAYMTFLPLQILATFEVNALAGILLAPVFGWVVYVSTLFEELT